MTGDEILRQQARINAELSTCPEATPSKFWERHNELHTGLLLEYGIENFKRTVSHNYFNWLTVKPEDIQIRRLCHLWALHGSMHCLTDKIEDPLQICATSLKDEQARRLYQFGVSLLWDYVLHIDSQRLLDVISEPVLGNPLRIWRGDTLLSQDLAHSVRERNRICEYIDADDNLVIGELGAGFGRLARMFHETNNCRYLIFDIAPALIVSQWYIRNLFPDEKVFTFRHFDTFKEVEREVEQSRFAFFSANQLEKLPDRYFDLFINICSLMEMRWDSILYFMRHIDRTTRGWFYSKQWNEQNNKDDGLKILKADYPIPKRWNCLFDNTDAINGRLFEQLWSVRHGL